MNGMNNNKAIEDMKRHIREVTVELDNEEYLEFMQELGNWVEDEIERAEYTVEEALGPRVE
jgi:hypothetical protein